MVNELIGYLLGALDADEHSAVEQAVQSNPDIQRKLEVLRKGLRPLMIGVGEVDVPAGLSERTCRTIRDCGSAQ